MAEAGSGLTITYVASAHSTASPSRHYLSPQDMRVSKPGDNRLRSPRTVVVAADLVAFLFHLRTELAPHRGSSPNVQRRLLPLTSRFETGEPLSVISGGGVTGGHRVTAVTRATDAKPVEGRRESVTDAIAGCPSGRWLLNQSILKKETSDESTLFLGRSRGGSCCIGPLTPRQRADALKRAERSPGPWRLRGRLLLV
jgi:hypothetical protein